MTQNRPGGDNMIIGINHITLPVKDLAESLDKTFILILPYFRGQYREKYYDMLVNEGFLVYPSVRIAGRAFLALYEYGRKIKRFNNR